ncbi:MAG: ATP-binding cassette domain-containing protein, partial [Saccharofermentanaceae bacterium]
MLEIKDLKKRFGAKQVLNGVDLKVPEHSVFGFVGQNGAGKTTTMKMILGLLASDEGEIYI